MHYAKVINNIVTEVIVAEADFFNTFTDSSPGNWLQTSYNTRGGKHYGQDGIEDLGTPLRKNYAGVGYIYDSTRDAFIEPQPYPSWTLNEDTCQYDSPVPYPDDDKFYTWDETTTNWIEVTE
jgi:hypothetical protein